MIHVIAFITAKPGKRAEILTIFNALVPTVRAEAGCIEYGSAVDVADAAPAFGPDVIVAIEKWADRDALQAHGASDHMKAFGRDIADLVANVAVHVLQPGD